MKILLTGDWQVSPRNLDRCNIALEFLLKCIDTYKVDAVGLLGDMKHAFNPVDQRVTNWLMMDMVRVIIKRVPVFVIEGNHDRVAIADGSETGLPIFEAVGSRIFTEPTIVSGAYKEPAQCFVPFFRDINTTETAIKKAIGKADILFFHNEVKGCDLGRMKSPTGIDPKLLAKFKVCIGGHIHKQQQVTYNTWFVGSPFCHDWGEANQFKGFLLLDTETFYVKPIPTPLPIWYDPMLPGFKPKSWKGVNVRITLPHDPKLAEAQKLAVAKGFPEAVFHFENQRSATTSNLELEHASDPELIRQYLEQNDLWSEPLKLQAYLEYKTADLGTGLRGLRGCEFETIEGENVLCFEKVTLALNRPGITMVTAENRDWGSGRSNGGGKSSYLSLPLLLLFGKTAKGQESDQWARQDCKKAAIIRGSIKLAGGKMLSILRGRRPGRLEIGLNSTALGEGDARATQRAIIESTGISWEVLLSSIYVGQAEESVLLLGTDKERKELFNQFLGLQRFQIAAERISADIKKTKLILANTEQDAIGIVQSIEQKQQWIARLKTAEEEQTKRNKQLVGWIDQLTDHKSRLAKLIKATQPVLAEQAAGRKAYQQLAHQVSTWTERLRSLKATLTSLTSNRICPACKRPLPKGETDSIKHIDKEIQTAERTLAEHQTKFKESSKTQVTFESVIQHQTIEQNNLRQLISGLEARIQESERTADNSGVLRDMQLEIKTELHMAKYVKAYIEDLRERIQFLQAGLKVVSRDGLPAFLCTLVCPELNAAAEEFSKAFAEAGIRVLFSGSEGEVDVSVQNPHGGERIEDQSAGEMRLAALITSFAMRSVLAPFGLIILDEPSEGMDSINASIFAKGLNQIAARFGTIFITTHNVAVLESLDFQHHIEIIKQNGISTTHDRG